MIIYTGLDRYWTSNTGGTAANRLKDIRSCRTVVTKFLTGVIDRGL